ncbi:hypothetical protein pipiens_010143 [Culex pipiens pipiens]|uniref:BHLH domain-containing protein n=1 Tax=Culex pipiens pipiens TaxID=38569 RepID=A0ABD1DB81_CULPP
MHHTLKPLGHLSFHQMPIMAALADANNNSNSSISSLTSSLSSSSPSSGSDEAMAKKDSEKYSLRQRQTRRSTPAAKASVAATVSEKKTVPKEKPKQKAPPLSKYRRKTANARERTRMREINSAFENLRQAVPVAVAGPSGNQSPVGSPGQSGANEKLTKITTLRLAMKYIRILSDILNNEDGSLMIDNNNDVDMVNHNDIEREVMLKGALLNETIFKAKSPSKASTRKSSRNSKPNKPPSLNLVPSLDAKDDLLDLGMMLDSDNDSLHLSEPCLSPPLPSTTSLHKQPFGTTSCNSIVGGTVVTPPSHADLEFGLFLESDADSLQLSEPCLSPLSHLDSLNPFNDLLHTGFNEQTALELYL